MHSYSFQICFPDVQFIPRNRKKQKHTPDLSMHALFIKGKNKSDKDFMFHNILIFATFKPTKTRFAHKSMHMASKKTTWQQLHI